MTRQSDLFSRFMSKWMGKGCNFDGVVGGDDNYQCVDLYKLWLNEIGYPKPERAIGGDGYAHSIWYQKDVLGLGEFFDYVTSNYQYGDVLIYTYSAYTPSTHVGFMVGYNGDGTHQCFGFNQGGDMTGRVIYIPDYAILGGLRLKEPLNETGFKDVDKSHFAYEPILWAKNEGIIKGYDNGEFRPNNPCTRADGAILLHNFFDNPSILPFEDVTPSYYAFNAISWLYVNKVAASAKLFNGGGYMTRGQAVTFLYRLAGSPPASGHVPFTDVKQGAFYYDAVSWAFSNVIVGGKTDTKFDPDSAVTRGELVTMIKRFNSKYGVR